MKTVCIINGGVAYQKMFLKKGWNVTEDFDEADLIQFCGGSDISPEIYGASLHKTMHIHQARDTVEIELFHIAYAKGIPMAGICRGSQFLHAMSGEQLWQHVDNHCGNHVIKAIGGLMDIEVSSTHHQMMAQPENKDSIVLAWAENISTFKERQMDGYLVRKENEYRDIEAVYHPHTNCICFQPHPEFDGINDCTNLYFHFINNYLFGE